MDQKRLAESLAHKYGTRDPFEIARALGYIVIRMPLYGIRGFCQYIKRCHVIFIDSGLNMQDSCFVCAHELGHSLLHKGYNRIFLDTHTHFVVKRYENEANRFAVDLLFDDDNLRVLLEFPIQIAADYMGVSTELAEYRMRTIKTP